MFLSAMFDQYFPKHLVDYILSYSRKLVRFMSPNIQITFHEFSGEHFNRSEAYAAIETYLSERSSREAKKLKQKLSKTVVNRYYWAWMRMKRLQMNLKGSGFGGLQRKKPQEHNHFLGTQSRRRRGITSSLSIVSPWHRDFVTGTYICHVFKKEGQ